MAEIEQPTKKLRLTLQKKWEIVAYSNFFRQAESLEFEYGRKNQIVDRFDISNQTLRNVIKEYAAQMRYPVVGVDLTPALRTNCGPDSDLTDQVRMDPIYLHNLIHI